MPIERNPVLIVLSPNDEALVERSYVQSATSPLIYGDAYVWTSSGHGRLARGEDLFFIGHLARRSRDAMPAIGDAEGDLALTGPQLWSAFGWIFPPHFVGRVYLHACGASDVSEDVRRLARQFKGHYADAIGNIQVFARSSACPDLITPPDGDGWANA